MPELGTENAQRQDWIARSGKPQREVRGLYHYYQRRADFRISTTDPDATSMGLKGGGVHLGYHVHYVVDGGKRRMPCQSLASAKSGSTQTCRLRMALW